MASEKKPQLQRERTVSATRPKPSLLTSTKAPTRGRVLPSGRDTLSAKEMGEQGSMGGFYKPAKEVRAGETEDLLKTHLRSSSCGELHPESSQAGSQKKGAHKVGSFGSTAHRHSKANAVGGQKYGSSTVSATLPASRTAKTLEGSATLPASRTAKTLEGSAKGGRSSSGVPASGRNCAVESADFSTKSATLSRLERQVLELREENIALRKELADARSLSEQLLHEAPSEKFTERRVHLLKSQIIQLERQVLLLSQAVSSRTEVLLELQNMLDSFLHKMSSLVKTADSSVTVPPHDFEDIICRARTMKGRLTRCSQSSSMESLAQPLMFMDAFLKPARTANSDNPVSLVDVCSGRTEHLNLKHVSRLESKLAELYGVLTEVEAALQVVPPNGSLPSLLEPIRKHLGGHLTKSRKLIEECCHQLLCLSLLVPAAPWPPLKSTEVSLDLRADAILERLPPFARSKKEGREVIEAAAKAFNYHSKMQATKCQALQQELQFHKSVYELQLNYVEMLFDAMGKGYQTFEQSAQELICHPLQAVLQRYEELSQTASDQALRNFLQTFKENHQQLQNAIESLKQLESQQPHPQGLQALSLFGQHFFESLSQLEAECTRKREDQLRLSSQYS